MVAPFFRDAETILRLARIVEEPFHLGTFPTFAGDRGIAAEVGGFLGFLGRE